MKKIPNISEKDGLQMPKDYFEDFDSRLKELIAFKELEGNKDNPFQVPAGYFDGLEKNLKSIKKEPKVIALNPKVLIPMLCVIAAILVILFLVIKPAPRASGFDSLSASNLENYLDQEDIQEFLSPEDVLQIEEQSTLLESYSLNDETLTRFNDQEELQDYLMDY